MYGFPQNMQYFDNAKALFPSKDILIGEFGVPQSVAADAMDSNLQSGLNLANSGDPAIRGGLIWACTDQDTVNTNQWGCYDATFSPRQHMLNRMRAFTGGSVAKCNAIR